MARIPRLSKFDAVFLHTDRGGVAMQVGVPIVLEGPIDFERYVAWLGPRVERIPRLREVLKPAPLHVRHPAWVPDDAFDLRNHVLPARVEAPGTYEELRELLTKLYHQRMAFERPLWRVYVVGGLDGNRSVIFFCFHHCLADGAGGMEILKVLFEPPPEGWASHVQAIGEDVKRERPGWAPLRVARTLASREGRARLGMMFQYLQARGPWFPFTRPASGRVHFAWRHIPLDELRAMRRALGATATDVVLTVVAGGLDRYAETHGVEVEGQFLRLLLPANVRLQEDYGELGNDLAMLPVLVPLGIADPVERLRRVAVHNRAMKALRMAEFIHGFMGGLLGLVTPAGQALVCKTLASRRFLRLGNRFARSPREHMLVTSVVFPPNVYYADGQAASALLIMVPCAFNMGLICSASAYRDHLHLLLTGDAEGLPDLDALMTHVEAAFEELKEAADSRSVIGRAPPADAEHIISAD